MIALLTAINIITATNMQRAVNNLPPLVENSRLEVAANRKAVDMASKQVFDHYYGKTTPWEFIEGEHYCYKTAGENLAVLFTDPNKVVEAWMASPKHKDNLLGDYQDIGISVVPGFYKGYKTFYIVQMFGKRCN